MAEPRHLSPLAREGPSGFDGASQDNEEYIEIGAKVKPSFSVFNNKRLAERLVDMILLPRDHELRSWLVDKIFTDFFSQLLGISILQLLHC